MSTTIDTPPPLELTLQAIDNPVKVLREYHAIYSPLSQRHAQRE